MSHSPPLGIKHQRTQGPQLIDLTGALTVVAMDTDTDSTLRDLVESAEAWIADDPDPETQRELKVLIAERDTRGLAERFAGPLTFGTAGLRGELGAGRA